jgi:CHAT domain-containing protein
MAQPTKKAELLACLPSANILHIACHGVQHATEPHKSHFCLSDGRLTVTELMEMDFKDACFAFLSACETAKGDRQYADEAVHLASTMLFAGFKSIVATMW